MKKKSQVYPTLSAISIFNEPAATYLAEQSRKGISFRSFLQFIESIPFSISEWSSFLHLSERTLQRYRKESRKFDPLQSERILQIALLYNSGKEVFGSAEGFLSWMSSPNVALGGKHPKEFLDSTFGIQQIQDELYRIAYGVLS